MTNDYIPSNDLKFDAWFNNLVEYVFSKVMAAQPAWTHIPKPEAEALSAAYTAWHTAYQPTLKPHTPVETEAKNNAKKTARTAARFFVNRFLRYPPVTDEDRAAMGIPNRDTTRTPHGPPEAEPDIVVENTRNHYQHKVRVLNPESGKGDKPKNAYGVRYGWQIGGVKPADGADMTKGRFSRKTALVITHTGADRGQPVFYSVCYENDKGDQGPWSLVEEALIG
jgi:hypothetical protein